MSGKVIIELDQYQHKAIANIVNEKRTNMIKDHKDTNFINEILEKIIKAPNKKKVFYKRDTNER